MAITLILKGERARLLTSPHFSFIQAILPRMEGQKSWLKNSGGLSFLASGHNLALVKGAVKDLQVINEAPEFEEFDARSLPPYVPKRKPRHPTQLAALVKARTQKHFALFMDPGTGKSWVAVQRAGEMFTSGEISGVVVLSKRGPHRQWAEVHFPLNCSLPSVQYFVWPKAKELNNSMLPGEALKVLCINWHGAKTKAGMALVESFIKAHRGRVYFIADESHAVGNPSSGMHSQLEPLVKMCTRRASLTGTSRGNGLVSEWAILKWMDESILGIHFKKSFENEYCYMGGFNGEQVIGYRDMARYDAAVEPYVFRLSKEEAGFLPPARTPWYFEMDTASRNMIKQIKKELRARLDSGEVVDVKNAAAAAIKIQQVSNGFIYADVASGDKTVKTTNWLYLNAEQIPRIDALKELIESFDDKEKIIVWARFKPDIEAVSSTLGEGCIVHDGRLETVEKFIRSDKRFFVGNPASAGTGLDGLQSVCRRDIFYSNSDNWVDRMQAESRIDREGAVGAVEHFDLVGRGSVDSKILGRHRRKTEIAKMSSALEIIEWLEAEEETVDELYGSAEGWEA